MIIKTLRFDEVDIPEELIFQVPKGLPGFPDEKEFAFLFHQDNSPFAYFQSTITPELTFLLVNPFLFFPDYAIEVGGSEAEVLGLTPENPGEVWCIASVKDKVENMTANLLAPLLINWKGQRAGQIVLEKTNYTTRHRIMPDGVK